MRRVAILCLLLTACTTSRVATQIERIVDDALATPVAEQRFAGVVLVARDGRPVFRKAYGLADRERNIPHTPDSQFMVMSVSKQFTAALIARLAAAGELRLDDRVSKYIEHWPAEWDAVEVRHLLSHASGLEIDNTYFWLIQHHPQYWPEPGPPPKYEPRPLATKPGTKYLYSNVGYTLLSMIAAKAGGRPFDELLRDELFRPLGLTHTVPERNGVRVPGRARGYQRTEHGLELAEQKTIDIVGAGDIVTTAGDLLRFSAAFDGDRFLPAQLRQDMLTAHVAGEGGTSLGYGWFLRMTAGGYRLQSHGGAGTGFRAFHGRLPDERLTVIVLSNVEQPITPWVFPLLDRLAAALHNTQK